MKNTRKKVSLVLALLLAGSACLGIGCGGGEDDSGKTKIQVFHYNGGVGDLWVKGAVERFEELHKDTVYEEGKKGVTVDFTNDDSGSNTDDIETSGYHMYFAAAASKLQSHIQQGYLLDISDVVEEVSEVDGKSIESKLDPTCTRELQGGDGTYYAVPHYEIYNGVSYDVDVFTEYNLFLAAPTETSVTTYKGVKFVKNSSTKKSCGADGIFDTSDDGLPTTLEEFVYLCERMKSMGVTPFHVCGYPTDYPNYMSLGLWTSLAGVDKTRVNFTVDGTINKVVGYETAPLFEDYDHSTSISYTFARKPIVDTEYAITPANHTELYDTVERYYSIAFMELCVKNGWIKYETENETHTDAQDIFMFNDGEYGMFIEGSYWFAQADGQGFYEDYLDENPDKEDRNVAWMPLPSAFAKEDAVTGEDNARTVAMMEFGGSYAFINANIEEKTGLVDACKDFLRFLYTDEELSAFTRETGTAKKLNYEMKPADYNAMSAYQKSVWDVRKTGGVVLPGSNNDFFVQNMDLLKMGNMHTSLLSLWGTNKDTQYNTYYAAFRSTQFSNEVNARSLFEHSSLTYKNV